MITIIFGKRGTGKTALNSYFALLAMADRQRYLNCINVLSAIGRANTIKQMVFEHAVYANYDLKNQFGHKRYFVDPFKMVMPNNDGLDYQVFLPFCSIHIMEGQIYWNSKFKLNPYSPAFFENSRHPDYDIFIDVQRPKKIALDIREIADKFITILNLETIENKQGKIIKCIWHCLEFDDFSQVDTYISTKDKTCGEQTTYTFNGCIFDYYDSQNNRILFYDNDTDIALTDGVSRVTAPKGYYIKGEKC